ncbi:hypothetical protein Ahia01_000155300 [Argonauta hians]
MTHGFFIDDLKLYTSTVEDMKQQLSLVTIFKRYRNEVWTRQYSYMVTKRGKITNQNRNLTSNGLNISPISDQEHYKYLGTDVNITYADLLTKERVTAEYKGWLRKI